MSDPDPVLRAKLTIITLAAMLVTVAAPPALTATEAIREDPSAAIPAELQPEAGQFDPHALALGAALDPARVGTQGPVSLGSDRPATGPTSSTSPANLVSPSAYHPAPDATTCDEPRPVVLRECTSWRTTIDENGGRDQVNDARLSPDGSMLFLAGESGAYGLTYNTPLYNASQFTVHGVDAQTGALVWSSMIDGPASTWDAAMGLEVSPDGDTVYATGYTDFEHALTVAYDADTGEQRWTAREDFPTPGWDIGYDLEVSPDGERLYLTGLSLSLAPGDYHTVAYDAGSGDRLWLSSHDGAAPGDGRDWAHSLALSPDGSTVVVTGESDSYTPEGISRAGRDIVTVAYDATNGQQLWSASYDGPAEDMDLVPFIGEILTFTSDGSTVLLTGASRNAGGQLDIVTLAYDADDGTQRWVHRADGGTGDGFPAELALSPDQQTVYVAALSSPQEASSTAVTTLALDATDGAQRWLSVFDGSQDAAERPSAISVSDDGDVYVSATANDRNVQGYGRMADIATVALDPTTGDQRWTAIYDGPTGLYDQASDVLAGDEQVIAVGTTLRTPGGQALPPGSDTVALSYPSDGPTPTVPGSP